MKLNKKSVLMLLSVAAMSLTLGACSSDSKESKTKK
jgi:hypothetical protein